MDLLAAEIARKRKAKTDEFGGSKYVKRSQIVAVREGKIRDEEEAEARAKRAKTGGTGSDDGSPATDDDDTAAHADGDDERRQRSKTAEGTKGARKDNDKNTAVDPDALDAEIAKLEPTEAIRRLRRLGQPATLFGELPLDRLKRLQHTQTQLASAMAQEEHGATGAQANEKQAELRALEEFAKRQREKGITQATEKKAAAAKKAAASQGPDGPTGADDAEAHDDLAQTFAAAAQAVAKARAAESMEPIDQTSVYFKSLIEEWERELESKPEDWVYSNAGKQSVANCRLCKQHMRPLFKRMKRRELPVDIERALFLIVKNMKDRNYRKAADMYIGIAVGNAAWPIGVTSVGIHDRSAREKISAQTQAHAMHDEETRKYLQSIKRLITFAQRAYPTTPSLSLDFNSGYNGWDKDSLIEADAKLDIKAQVPALLALPANGDGWKAQDGDTRTWKSLLTHAYEGTEFAKRKGKVDMDKIRTMKDEIIARDKGMYDARSGHLGKGFGERNDERNRG